MKIPPLPRLDFIANFLNSRSPREKQMIIIFMVLAVVVVDYVLFLDPAIRMIVASSPRVRPLKEELNDLVEDSRQKDEIHKKWENVKRDLENRNLSFIAPDGVSALLEGLSQDAQKSGVRITSLEPSEGAKGSGGSYFPLPIEIKANAGTHEFGQFLSTLENSKTFFRVKDLKVMSNPQSERKHQFDLFLEAYRREK